MIETQNNIKRVTSNLGRYYEKDGVKYPSVTWICSYYPKNEGFWKWKLLTKDSDQIFKDAGTKGTTIHKNIENLIRNKPRLSDLTESNDNYTNQFIKWIKSLKNAEIIDIEKFVINKDDKYAGTVDLIMKIDGQMYIVDIKTSKSLHITHELQLSAYKHAIIEENLTKDCVGYGTLGKEKYKLALLKLSEESYEFKEVDDKYDLFLAIKKIFDYEQGII